jgi:hypothetical protein
MNRQYPQVLYPVFRLQITVMNEILGAKWWSKKNAQLEYWKIHKRDHDKKAAESAERWRIIQRNRQVLYNVSLQSLVHACAFRVTA